MKHFVKYDLTPILSVIVICLFPCVFLYARNADEVPASSMLPFFLVFLVNSLLFILLCLPFYHNCSRAAFFTDIAMLVVINFSLIANQIEKLCPAIWSRYVFIFFALLLLALFVLLLIRKPDLRTGCLLLLIAFGSVTIMNFGLSIPTILKGREVHELHDDTPTGITFEGDRPNVYYFLFDEYGGYENLKRYYDYDNGPFLDQLADRGFNVARESHNTEAVDTNAIVPNLLNLDYVVEFQSPGAKKEAALDNTFMTRMFRENGYQVNMINQVDFLGTSGCRVLSSHQTRRTISEYLMRNSLYDKFPQLHKLLEDFFTFDYGANYRAGLDNAMEAERNCWKETGGKPTLTIGYLQFPHSPTMVGPHGEELDFQEGWNWTRPELYLGQVQYANDYILGLVDDIQKNDPDAIIFLMSDHGNRYPLHMCQIGERDTYDPVEENPYMQNILNCVYYQGESFPIEGETGINTMRLVFRDVFHADLPPVKPIQDNSMRYQDETA